LFFEREVSVKVDLGGLDLGVLDMRVIVLARSDGQLVAASVV